MDQETPAWPRRVARSWSASSGAKRTLPSADRLVRDLEAALEEQLSDVAEAQLGAQPPEHGEQHDIRRVLEIVDRRAAPLVEVTSACPAVEPRVAERGAAVGAHYSVRSPPQIGKPCVGPRRRGPSAWEA